MNWSNAVLAWSFSLAVLAPQSVAVAATPVRALTNAGTFEATDDAPHAIPLTDDGATSKTVKLVGTRLMISYNAQCTAAGPDGSYLSVSILVDGQPTVPDSGTNFAFCSPAGAGTHTYMAVVKHGTANVVGRSHTYQVIGTGVNTTSWALQDMILTILSF